MPLIAGFGMLIHSSFGFNKGGLNHRLRLSNSSKFDYIRLAR